MRAKANSPFRTGIRLANLPWDNSADAIETFIGIYLIAAFRGSLSLKINTWSRILMSSLLNDNSVSFWDEQAKTCSYPASPLEIRHFWNALESERYRYNSRLYEMLEFSLWKDKKVLDLGCGMGIEALNFARLGAKVMAVDISPAFLAHLERASHAFRLESRLTVAQGDMEKLSLFLPPQKFDLILALDSIQWLRRPEGTIAEIAKYLKPGGLLRVVAPHQRSFKYLMRDKRKNPAGTDAYSSRKDSANAPNHKFYTKSSLKKLLDPLKINNMRIDYLFPWNENAYNEGKFVKKFPYRFMPQVCFDFLSRLVGEKLIADAALE